MKIKRVFFLLIKYKIKRLFSNIEKCVFNGIFMYNLHDTGFVFFDTVFND